MVPGWHRQQLAKHRPVIQKTRVGQAVLLSFSKLCDRDGVSPLAVPGPYRARLVEKPAALAAAHEPNRRCGDAFSGFMDSDIESLHQFCGALVSTLARGLLSSYQRPQTSSVLPVVWLFENSPLRRWVWAGTGRYDDRDLTEAPIARRVVAT